jgi:phage major head subunit gpT-like protein
MAQYISDRLLRTTRDDLQEEFREVFDDNNGTYKEIFNEITVPDNDAKSKYLKGISFGGKAMPVEYQIGETVVETTSIDGYEYLIEYKLYRDAMAEYVIDAKNAKSSMKGLFDATMEMTDGFANRVEVECFELLNNGTSTNGPDGVAIFSASHPIKDNKFDSDTVWSNYLTSTAFDHDNFFDARYQLKAKQRKLDGDKALIKPAILLVPDALETEARQFAMAEFNKDNANNEPNPDKGFRVVVAPRLTDNATRANSTWYVMGDKKNSPFVIAWRMKPQITIEEVPSQMKVVTYMNMYFGVGVKHPHGIVRCDA